MINILEEIRTKGIQVKPFTYHYINGTRTVNTWIAGYANGPMYTITGDTLESAVMNLLENEHE